jgi:hypothetical protein
LKTFRQDVLEETAQKFGGSELENTPLLIGAIFILEGDLVILGAEDALRTQSGVVNVSRQILDSGLTAASGLDIDDPWLAPDKTWNRAGVRHLL